MRVPRPSLALVLLVLGAASFCSAGNITYDVNLTIGAGSVTGTITTDGTIGVLLATDIVDFNLLLTDPFNTYDLVGPSGVNDISDVIPSSDASDLSATPTDLLFDFTPGGDVFFETPDATTVFQLTNSSANGYESFYINGDGGEEVTEVFGTQVIATASGTPEPSTLALFLGAGIALLGLRKFSSSRHDSF